MPPAAVGGGLRAPMPPLGVHGYLFSSILTFFFVRSGSYFLSHGIRHAPMMPKSGRAFVNCRSFKLAREPSQRLARGCRPSWPLPSTHRLRDGASACKCACRRTNRASAHAERLQLLVSSYLSQPSHNKPGPRRFDDRDCDREGRASLSTRSRAAITIRNVVRTIGHS